MSEPENREFDQAEMKKLLMGCPRPAPLPCDFLSCAECKGDEAAAAETRDSLTNLATPTPTPTPDPHPTEPEEASDE